MHEVLQEYLHRSVLVYIDDILIYPRRMADHRHHVAEVLREFHLFLKAEKCSFHQPSVEFLGYNISDMGILMDEGKVETIQNWPTPSTIKELQRFLGFANFYRRFFISYSSITNPLTSLPRNKPKSLSWSPSANEAFQLLKRDIHQCTTTHPARPRETFCRGSGCIPYRGRSGAVSAAGDTSQTPSMHLLP